MIIMIIYAIISFLLDGFVSNYTGINIVNPSYLRTIYSLVSLVIIYNYFENDKKYLYLLFCLGIFFDIVYTNTPLLNIFIFFVIFIVLKQLDYIIPNNILTINIKSLICISIYHTMSYFILVLVAYHNYPINLLTKILSRSIIMTIIYSTISYLIIKKIYFNKYDKKIK